jgi:DNA-directed RNA polymerase subunit RPC12/RpoP
LWLAVASEDAPHAARIVHGLWGRELDLSALAAASQAIDLDAREATCPACGSNFPPAVTRCPGCGLRFG